MYIRISGTNVLGVTEPHTCSWVLTALQGQMLSIYLKVRDTLYKKGISLSGLCSMSTDGASVMVGCKSGVLQG